MEKKVFKRHNTKLQKDEYLALRELQTKLLATGVDINLNEVLQGCIKYVRDKGITNNDTGKYFNFS
jgi:hypothetical protein